MYDMVLFNFMAKNHTLTQSTFPKPCNKMMGGIDSGFMPNDGKGTPPTMMLQVNSTEPIWFYCRQKKPMPHCGAGMTFSINPTGEKSQAAFKAKAIAINGTSAAAGAVPAAGSMPADAAAAAAAPVAATMPMGAAPVTTMAVPADAAASMPAEIPTGAQQNTGVTGNTGTMGAGMVQGTGQTDAGGSCTCSCMCGTQAFPADSGLGLGMVGGLPGRLRPLIDIRAEANPFSSTNSCGCSWFWVQGLLMYPSIDGSTMIGVRRSVLWIWVLPTQPRRDEDGRGRHLRVNHRRRLLSVVICTFLLCSIL